MHHQKFFAGANNQTYTALREGGVLRGVKYGVKQDKNGIEFSNYKPLKHASTKK